MKFSSLPAAPLQAIILLFPKGHIFHFCLTPSIYARAGVDGAAYDNGTRNPSETVTITILRDARIRTIQTGCVGHSCFVLKLVAGQRSSPQQ